MGNNSSCVQQLLGILDDYMAASSSIAKGIDARSLDRCAGPGDCILDRAQVQFLIICLKNVVALASETASMTKLALPLELGME